MAKESSTSIRIQERRKQLIRLFIRHGSLSKNDIFKLTRYSISTVISTVDDMYSDGIIEINEAEVSPASIGRKAVFYSLSASYGYSVGVDINSDTLSVTLIDFKKETVNSIKWRIPSSVSTLREIIDHIPALIDAVCAPLDKPRLLCIGVAAPGLVDFKEGRIIYYSRFRAEHDTDIASVLRERYCCPVYLDKSLNCLATAYKEHEQRPLNDMILISIRTGVGMSCILNGSIYRGANGMAGEIGHMLLPSFSPTYIGSKTGSLDAEVSIYSITRKLDAVFGEFKDEDGQPMSMAQKMDVFIRMVRDKQPNAIRILDEICFYLGYAVNQVINLLNPSDVLFYGEITQCGDIFLEHLNSYIAADELRPNFRSVNLGIAELSRNAFAEGAAYYAFDCFLSPGSSANY